MANSRELVECMASALGKPPASVRQHMRNLREASTPLVTTGGRGIAAPTMSKEDGASLLCAVLGSEAVHDSVEALQSLRRLPAVYQGQRLVARRHTYGELHVPIQLGLKPKHDIVLGLTAVFAFFDREEAFRDQLRTVTHRDDHEIYASVEVHYPEYFASFTVGIRGMSSETWTYGARQYPRTEQIRRCRQASLRDIAACLRSV